MPTFPAAGVAEILRSAQKDEVYSEELGKDISELSLEVLGPRIWLRWKAYLEATAAFAYLSATTLCDYQTLGEEYAGLLQVHQVNLPSRLRRMISIALYCFGPLGMSAAIGSLKRRVAEDGDMIGDETKGAIGVFLETARAVLPQVHRLNISAFFLGSAFYHLSKRLTGIEYVKVGAFGVRHGAAPTFRLLGVISLINVIAAISHTVWTRWRRVRVSKLASSAGKETEPNGQSSPSSSARTCVLCLDAMRSPSCCSTCGHTFCWNCIMESLSVNEECPLCRVRTEPRQVVPLMNYE